MIAIGQYTIAVVSDGVTGPQGPQGVSVTKMVREYCKSSSSTSLPTNPNWTETEPTIGANEYLWARDRTDKSDGTSSYGPAICSTNISDVKHNVDKANKSITDKVWESDITTKINQYDGSTVSTIRDRVTSTEQNISGITSRVSDVESSVTDETNQRKATFGTCDTGAGTAAKAVTCENFELHAGSTISVKFTNTNTTASPTLNVNSTGAKAIKSYTGQDLTEGEYKWAAGSVYDFIYDGQYWRLSDSGSLKRITSAESSITQNATNIELKVSKDGVISSINQSPESVTINANKVNIEGAAIFSSGRLSQTNLNNAYDSKGSAAAVQTNLDNLEIGGRNYYKNYSGNISIGSGATATKDVSINGITGNNTATSGTKILRLGKVITEQGYWTVSGYIKSENSFTLTGDICDVVSTLSLVTTTEYQYFSFTVNVTRAIDNTYNFVDFNIGANAGNFWFKDIKVEKGNKPTAWTPAPEDQFASTVPCYYRKTTSGAPSAPSSTVGTSNNTDNTWTYVMPLPKKNCYFFICEEYTNVGGTKSYSTVRALDSQTYTSKWVSSSDQTYIDGGSIYTHSITTSQLATDAIKSTNYLAGGSNSPYSSAGTFLDLSNGNFYTPNFGVQSLTGKAYLNGEIIAISGSIGDDSGNYWEIGNTIDSQGNGSASIVGNGTAYIQDGDWQIHSGLSNYSNGSINTQWYIQPQGQGLQLTYPYYNGYYYDYGMTSPVLDANSDRFYNQTVSQNFLYIRKHASTIPALESDWNYIFRVDKDGMIWINGQSLTQMIQSGVDGGAYVPTSGGTITGNLTVTGTLTATASKANQLTHSISVNGKAFDGSADVTVGTIGAAYGGTGQTSLKAAGTAIIGALDTNTTTPVDNDYIATGSSTFYRKTMSKLWDYIKGKLSADHSSLDSLYVQKSGDTMTGSLTVENGIYADSAQLGDLIVSGSGRFANGLYGNLIGNADTATKAAKISDTGDGSEITISINKPQLSTTNFIAVWDGHEIRAISPANLRTTIGAISSSNPTFTSEVISQNGGIWVQGGSAAGGDYNRMTLTAGMPTELKYNGSKRGTRLYSNAIAFADPYNGNSNNDSGWIRHVEETSDQGYLEIAVGDDGNEPIYVRQYNTSSEVRKQITLLDGSGNSTFPGTVTASSFSGNASSATKATQDGNGNTIASTYLKLSGGVLTKADGVTFTANAGDVVYVNTNSIIQSPISGSLWHDLWAFCEATIPKYYTTTNGTTWTEATLEKRLFAHLENWGNVNVISSTISGSRWEWDNGGFAYSNGYWLVFGIMYSATIAKFDVILESSNDTGDSATWTTLMSSTGVSVNQQPVWIKCKGSAQNNLRLTIKRNSASDNTTKLPVCSIRLLSSRWGNQGKGKEYEYPYTWDGEGNITAKGTFTGTFNGNATSATSATSATTATKLNSTRSFTIGNTAKNVDWSGAVSYSKAEISDEASSTANGWMSVADKKKLDSITVSDIGTIGANSIRGEKDIKVTISSGVATIGHENSAITAGTISGTATSTLSNGGSFKIPSITYDAYGHITGTAQTTITLPNITSVTGNAGTATAFSSNREIKLTGDVTGSASSNGTSGWSITTTVGNDSHQHTPSTIIPGDASSTGTLDPITQSMIGSASSNKSFGLPANAITVEYSTNGGSTWTDYGATDAQKRALFNETRSFSAYLGKATAKASNNINNQLRITIEPLDRYVSFNGLYIWFSTQGNTCTVDLERSTIGAKDTFVSVFSGQPISGWAGNNIRYFNGGSFGGGTNQTTNNYKYRLTFKQKAINADYPSAIVMDVRFLGLNVWNAGTAGTGSYNMLTTNRLYVWDDSFNVSFPAGITATSFNGNATSATESNKLKYYASLTTDEAIDGFLEANRFRTALWTSTSSVGGVANGVILSGAYSSTDYGFQLAIDDDPTYFIALRQKNKNGWADWKRIPMADGTGASGNWSINANTATTATYSYYPKFVASNELRFDVNSKPSSAINLCVGYKWSDGTSDAKINRYNFYNGGTGLAEVGASTFYGSLSGNATSATKATQDASGNTITSYYCTLSTNQTISGTKTFSAMPLSSAGICVNSGGSGTAGGVSLWSDKDIKHYGLALRMTTDSGKHGFVQGDYATYNYMYSANAAALSTRGWIFKDSVNDKGVASISGAGNAVFDGSVTVGGNATNTSGCRQEFDSTLNCLNFIFN